MNQFKYYLAKLYFTIFHQLVFLWNKEISLDFSHLFGVRLCDVAKISPEIKSRLIPPKWQGFSISMWCFPRIPETSTKTHLFVYEQSTNLSLHFLESSTNLIQRQKTWRIPVQNHQRGCCKLTIKNLPKTCGAVGFCCGARLVKSLESFDQLFFSQRILLGWSVWSVNPVERTTIWEGSIHKGNL